MQWPGEIPDAVCIAKCVKGFKIPINVPCAKNFQTMQNKYSNYIYTDYY